MIKFLGDALVALNGAFGIANLMQDNYLIGAFNLSIFLYYLMKDIRGE